MQGKAEDEGILTYVEDDNAAMCSPGRQTCSDICLVCYNAEFVIRNAELFNFFDFAEVSYTHKQKDLSN